MSMSKPYLTVSQKYQIVKLYQAGELSKNIAAKFNCHPSYPPLLTKRRKGSCRTKVEAYWNVLLQIDVDRGS